MPAKWLAPLGFCGILVISVARSQEPEPATASSAMAPSSPPLAVAPFDTARAREHQEAWARHLGVPVEITNSIGMKLRLIPPGEFLMGAPPDDSQAAPEERPQHRVRLTRPFYLGVHEVTNAQFQTFVTATDYQTEVEADGQGAWIILENTFNPARTWRKLAEVGADRPVTCVTWKDNVEFCGWLSGREGRSYRLPTEAEWEYACRAGTTTDYSFGNRPDHAQANVASGRLTGVGSRAPNPFGLYDMHGNAHERCVDGRRAYTVEPVTDPLGPMLSDSFRVVRGGGMITPWPRVRASIRLIDPVPFTHTTLGFRVAMVGDLDSKGAAARDVQPTGDDAKQAAELEVKIRAAMLADRWDEAIMGAEKLVALWKRVPGKKDLEVASAASRLSTYRLVAAMGKHERAEFIAADDLSRLAQTWQFKGKYVDAQPLFEKALEIRRRLLTDDHLDTATSSRNLAANFAPLAMQLQQNISVAMREDRREEAVTNAEELVALRKRVHGENHFEVVSASWRVRTYRLVAAMAKEERAEYVTAGDLFRRAHALYLQGKYYAAAQPLFEKALEIYRRLLTDEHPDTATIYYFLALNLRSQGKYAAAQPLFEKALEIHRRLLTDDHPDTAMSYGGLGNYLRFQGRYTAAQPLFEKALEIRRRLLTDDHPDTALSYSILAVNLWSQGKHATAQPLFEKVLDINRRLLTDDHPETANSYNNLAANLWSQGKYATAQPLLERALDINRRLLTDDHPNTANSYNSLAYNLNAQGKYREAVDQMAHAARSGELSRLNVAFDGLDRTAARSSELSPFNVAFGGLDQAAVWSPDRRQLHSALLARLERGAEAWQRLEERSGRGLLDELAARNDKRLTQQERDSLRQLVTELGRLDRLFEAPMPMSDQAERRKRLDDLRQERARVQIALGEMQTRLVTKYGPLAGEVAPLAKIQASLPADTALIAWVDFRPPTPNSADPDGEHWGVVVRATGNPVWVKLQGTGKDQHWIPGDDELSGLVRSALRDQAGPGSADWRRLVQRLYEQRLVPLAEALAATPDGLPTARRLIVLPSAALALVPVEALLRPEDPWTISYAPSATVLTYLRHQPHPDPHAGLLVLGDPVFEERPATPAEPGPLPEHGLLLTGVVPGSNAANHGLKRGDVLLAYNGTPLHGYADLKAVPAPGDPVPVEVWRDGRTARREVACGALGAVIDPQPARVALEGQRRFEQLLAMARSGNAATFPRLPGTRFEVAELARLFAAAKRPTRLLLDAEASEPELDRLASSGALGRFGFIHLATHGVIDEQFPQRTAVILTQTGLPDPLTQMLDKKPVYDGRLVVHEIQRDWDLRAELVTLSACETAQGRFAGGEGFIGFTQSLLLSGARSVCLSLWKVDDTATAMLMRRFYSNLLGGVGPGRPQPKAEALAEAKAWLRGLSRAEAEVLAAELSDSEARGKGAPLRRPAAPMMPPGAKEDRPYAHPYYWAAFVLIGDPD